MVNLRKRALRHLGAVAAVCMLVSACSPGSTPPPTAPPGTPAAPSNAAATPRETQLERQQRLDFEAAEKSYRAFRAEYTRLAQAGGVSKATAEMKRVSGGPYLAVMTKFLRITKNAGMKQHGVVGIAYVRPGAYSPGTLSLNVCEDGRRVTNYNKKGAMVDHGLAVKSRLDVKSVDGLWKVWDGDDARVQSCAE